MFNRGLVIKTKFKSSKHLKRLPKVIEITCFLWYNYKINNDTMNCSKSLIKGMRSGKNQTFFSNTNFVFSNIMFHGESVRL